MDKKFTNKIQLLIGALAVLSSVQVMANTGVTGVDAHVTVQNTFTFSKSNALDFGSISAKADGTGVNTATLVISPNPDTAPAAQANADAFIHIINEGTPASFTVSGVAPNTSLTITFPAPMTLTEEVAATPASPVFTVDNWKAYIVNGANPGSAYTPTTPNLTSDASGNITFNVGATLYTDANDTSAGSNGNYADGVYSSTFDLTINY